MVFCSISETYDLSTKANKMSLLAIHTPSKEIIQKTYPGLCMNSKYCRIVKQDVVLACASALPLSPEIVGSGADMIAPEDAFNPILYKAVSNESMSTLEARLLGLHATSGSGSAFGSQVYAENDNVTGLSDEFNVYYSLLSNRDGFKTANPQQGLSMKGLVPLVFEKYYNIGTNATYDDRVPVEPENPSSETLVIGQYIPRSMRGRAHPMPKFNTTYLTSITQTPIASGSVQPNGMGDGLPRNSEVLMPDILPVYTACIVMPPSRQHQLYYRMVVRTTLEFTEVRPITEIASFQALNDFASVVYHSDYTSQSKDMTAKAGMVDAKDAEINKIMEGS